MPYKKDGNTETDPWDSSTLPSTLGQQGIVKNQSTVVSTETFQVSWIRSFFSSLLGQTTPPPAQAAAAKMCADGGGIVFKSSFLIGQNATEYDVRSCFAKGAAASFVGDVSGEADPVNARTAVSQQCYTKCYNAATDWLQSSVLLTNGQTKRVTDILADAGGSAPFYHRVQLEWCQADCVCQGAVGDATKQETKLKSDADTAIRNQDSELLNIISRLDINQYAAEIQALRDEVARRKAEITQIRDDGVKKVQDIAAGAAGQCFQQCMTGSKFQVACPARQPDCCRAQCVADVCKFERPPTPNKSYPALQTPAPPGGDPTGATTGGGGAASSAARVASSVGVSSAISSTATSGGTTGGTTGGAITGGSSSRRSVSSWPVSSTASVAVSGEACITTFTAPAEYVPDPSKQLGDGQQFGYTGQFFIPWNFQDARRIQKDFNVFLGDVVYQKGTKRFTRGTWSTVTPDGTFSKPIQADVPTIPNDKSFKTSSGLYDGKDTIWNLALQDSAECKKEMVDNSERSLCNIHVQKTTVSTNTAKQVVIPNTSWLQIDLFKEMVNGGDGWSLVASDGSLWFAIARADVIINVRPDMNVKIIPFPSKGCTSVGRPVSRYGDSYCRGASRLAEGPDGSIWFTTDLQAEAEKFPQIGIVKKDGTVKMVSFAWEDMIFVQNFFPGYDGAMWFTYRQPNMLETTLPDPNKYVARMTLAGELSFVQTPASVARMAAGKDGMWFLGNIIKGSAPAQPTYQPVLGFIGKTASKLQTLPTDVFRRPMMYQNPLLVDANNVPWTRNYSWKYASSASSLTTTQYWEPVTFLPDTQSVIKFACGSSSSKSSSRSSFSSSSSAGVCPANGCTLNGNAGDTFCASQGMVCTATDTLPCVKCVPKNGSSSSKAPDPRCQQNGCTQLGGNNACESIDATCRPSTDFPCFICDFNASSARSSSSRSSSNSSAISAFSAYSTFSLAPSYSSSFSVPPSYSSSSLGIISLFVCGNGIVEGGEQCDDGNLSDADACTTQCELNSYWISASSVPPAFARSSVSSSALVAIDPSRPGFDPRFCGNGVLNPGEDCDIGLENSDLPNASCRTDCSISRCGDQIVDNIRGEQCDDGNAANGDGCSFACAIEQFAGQPDPVLPGSLIELPFVPGTPNQASVLPNVPAHGPVGDTGPETVAIMAAGASAGYTWMRMRGQKKK